MMTQGAILQFIFRGVNVADTRARLVRSLTGPKQSNLLAFRLLVLLVSCQFENLCVIQIIKKKKVITIATNNTNDFFAYHSFGQKKSI